MPKLTQTERIERIDEIHRLRAEGYTDTEIAELLKVSRERIAQLAGRRRDDHHAAPLAIRDSLRKYKGGRTRALVMRCTPETKRKLEELSRHAKAAGSPAHTQADLVEKYILEAWEQTFGA